MNYESQKQDIPIRKESGMSIPKHGIHKIGEIVGCPLFSKEKFNLKNALLRGARGTSPIIVVSWMLLALYAHVAVASSLTEKAIKYYRCEFYEEAYAIFDNNARNGDVLAMYWLGVMYSKGKGVSRNDETAFSYYSKAASKNLPEAQYELGNAYFSGIGVRKSKPDAIAWYEKSANQGNSLSQYVLGDLYRKGDGVNQDKRMAFKWMLLAAKNGHPVAQLTLSEMYLHGEGIEKNEGESLKWRQLVNKRYSTLQKLMDVMEADHSGNKEK